MFKDVAIYLVRGVFIRVSIEDRHTQVYVEIRRPGLCLFTDDCLMRTDVYCYTRVTDRGGGA